MRSGPFRIFIPQTPFFKLKKESVKLYFHSLKHSLKKFKFIPKYKDVSNPRSCTENVLPSQFMFSGPQKSWHGETTLGIRVSTGRVRADVEMTLRVGNIC
jgi:hypothetical protein